MGVGPSAAVAASLGVAGANNGSTLTPDACRAQSIGSPGARPVLACLPEDPKRHECSRGEHVDLVELEPSLMAVCQPGARVHADDGTGSSWPRIDALALVEALPNRTVLMIGDSTMRQFFDAIVCDLLRLRLYECVPGPRHRCKRLWRHAGDQALSFVRARHPSDGSWTDFALKYLHSFPPHGEEVEAFANGGVADVVVFNFGVHYLLDPPRRRPDRAAPNASAYAADLKAMVRLLDTFRRQGGAVVFLESVAQHFGCRSTYFSGSSPKDSPVPCAGDWDSRDRTRYFTNADALQLATTGSGRNTRLARCRCFPFQAPTEDEPLIGRLRALPGMAARRLDLQVGWRNALALAVLREEAGPGLAIARWFEITKLRYAFHRTNCCTSIKSTCDCTHFCFNDVMYQEGFAELVRALRLARAR